MAISLQSVQQPQTTHSVNPNRGVRSQIKQDVQALSTALQSGDLQTAQKSYGDLQKLLQGNGSISQASTSTATTASSEPLSAIKADFQKLGTDLQSGDLSAAQKDYAQLATDSSKIVSREQGGTRQAGGRHGQHGPPPPPPPDNDSDDNAASTSSSTSAGTSSTSLSAYKFQLSATFSGTGSPTDASPFAQVKTDFLALSKDLQAGNSDSAQKDYAQLLKDAQSLGASNSTTGTGAYQYTLNSQFETASATSDNASATQSASLFNESLLTTNNDKTTYQSSSDALSYKSVNVVA